MLLLPLVKWKSADGCELGINLHENKARHTHPERESEKNILFRKREKVDDGSRINVKEAHYRMSLNVYENWWKKCTLARVHSAKAPFEEGAEKKSQLRTSTQETRAKGTARAEYTIFFLITMALFN